MNILQQIIADSRIELARRKELKPYSILEREAASVAVTADFAAAFADKTKVNIIAELKKASPSQGIIREHFCPAELAGELSSNGAAALSVLTETKYFKGGLENLAAARRETKIPLLRKDFIYDEYQLLEARACGADAALLIVAALPPARLCELISFAAALNLQVLVETHNRDEINIALDVEAGIIGVNSRNLKDFSIDLDEAAKMLQLIPENKIKIMESGIKTVHDIKKYHALGADGFLIGESLMRQAQPGVLLRKLTAC